MVVYSSFAHDSPLETVENLLPNLLDLSNLRCPRTAWQLGSLMLLLEPRPRNISHDFCQLLLGEQNDLPLNGLPPLNLSVLHKESMAKTFWWIICITHVLACLSFICMCIHQKMQTTLEELHRFAHTGPPLFLNTASPLLKLYVKLIWKYLELAHLVHQQVYQSHGDKMRKQEKSFNKQLKQTDRPT